MRQPTIARCSPLRHAPVGRRRRKLTGCEGGPYTRSAAAADAHPDDRAGAVLRAPGHPVQRIPPHPRAARARPHGRSRHLSVRPATSSCRACASSAACGRRSSTHVRIGPSLAKVPLDLTLAATALRRALARRYDAVHSHEEGSLIGVRARRRMLGVPHLYDMHSSLPQQLDELRLQPIAAAALGASSWIERLRDPALAGRDRDLPAARGRRCARIDPLVPDGADRERAGLGRYAGRRAPARAMRAALGLAAGRAGRALHRDVRGLPGARSAVRGAPRVVRRDAARRAVRARRRTPDQVDAARAQAARARASTTSSIFAGQRPAEEIPQFLDAADVLVSPRSRGTNTPLKIYQYLRVGPADRRDAAADAHAGARRRGRDPDRGDAGGVRRRHPAAPSTIRRERRRDRRARAAAGRDEVQLRGLPRRGRARPAPSSVGSGAAAGRAEASRDSRPSHERSLQLRRLRRSGDGRGVRRAAVRRADRRADRRDAGARARRVPRRRSPAARMLDVGTGTGRAAIALAAARRARHRRRRVGGDAARRPARARERRGGRRRFARAMRTRLPFADRAFDAVVCLRVLMHTPDWRAVARRAVPRRARPRGVRLSGAGQRRGAAGGGAPRSRTRPARAIEAYRVFSDGAIARRARARTASASRDRHRQFVLPIALHKRRRLAAFTDAHRRRARARSGCCGCSARR